MATKLYEVLVREVHIQSVLVEAKSADDAIGKVAEGEGDFVDNSLVYSDTLELETWTAKEAVVSKEENIRAARRKAEADE